MNAAGALSRPSVTNSRCLTLPSRTHCDMSRRKSACRAAKSLTMKPRIVRRLVSTARIIDDAHFGTDASVSLYCAIRPQTGTRAKALSSGNTAAKVLAVGKRVGLPAGARKDDIALGKGGIVRGDHLAHRADLHHAADRHGRRIGRAIAHAPTHIRIERQPDGA